jgi:hypothetical protein
LFVIPEGNPLLPSPLPLPLLFCLSFPKGIRFCPCVAVAFAFLFVIPEGNPLLPLRCRCLCFSVCHSRRESASAVAVAFAFLFVIPEGNPLLPLPLPLLFCLSFPKGIRFCFSDP